MIKYKSIGPFPFLAGVALVIFVIGLLLSSSPQVWDIQTVDSVDYYGGYTSIALDSNDYPHISYQGSNATLCYARWTGTSLIEPDPSE